MLLSELFIPWITTQVLTRKTTWPTQSCKSDIQSVKELNTTHVFGDWYQVRKNYNAGYSNGDSSECARFRNIPGPNDKYLIFGYKIVNGMTMLSFGEGSIPDLTKPGDHKITYFRNLQKNTTFEYKYLGVDFNSFIILYRCIGRVGLTEIYTREQHPSQSVIAKATKVLADKGLDVSNLYANIQDNCSEK